MRMMEEREITLNEIKNVVFSMSIEVNLFKFLVLDVLLSRALDL